MIRGEAKLKCPSAINFSVVSFELKLRIYLATMEMAFAIR